MNTFNMKNITLATLATSALALGACSSSDDATTTDQMASDANTTDSTDAGQAVTETGTETTGSDATSNQGSGAQFDTAAIVSALEGAGYQCTNDDCMKEENGLHLDIDVEHDSVDTQVEVIQDGDIEAGWTTILNDLESALGDFGFGGQTFTDIRSWAESNAAEREVRQNFGDYEVKIENDTDDRNPERSLDIEHIHS